MGDLGHLALGAVLGHRLRSALSMLGIGIGKLRFGMSIDEMKAILGEPQRTTGYAAYEYLDQGFAVVAARNDPTVLRILCGAMAESGNMLVERFKYRTAEGIGMRSSKGEIVKAYGPPDEERHVDEGDLNIIELNYKVLGAVLVLRDDQVVYITLRPLPDMK